MFNRIDAKQAAKQSISRANPSPMLVTLVFLLLTTGISTLIGQFVSNPFTEAAEYIYQGYDPEEAMEYALRAGTGVVGLYSVVSFLFSLYRAVMDFGYTSYTMQLARNEGAGIASLFLGFSRCGQVLWLNILNNLFVSLWGLAGALPGLLLMALGGLTRSYGLIVGSTFIMAGGMVALACLSALRYTLAPYFLLDHRAHTAREAITQSKNAMRGWKMELLLLQFSFFGWILLAGLIGSMAEGVALFLGAPGWVGVLAGSVLMLWVGPYMNCTKANFYDAVTGRLHIPPFMGGYNSNYGYDGSSGSGPDDPPPF